MQVKCASRRGQKGVGGGPAPVASSVATEAAEEDSALPPLPRPAQHLKAQ